MPHITKHKTYFIFGKKYYILKFVFKFGRFFTSLCASLLFHSNLECRIDRFFSLRVRFASVKILIWSKSKRCQTLTHTRIYTQSHTRMKTRKTQIKWKKNRTNRKKRWTCILFEIQNYDLFFIYCCCCCLCCCCHIQWTILFTINLVCLDSVYLYYAIQFAWLFSDLLKMHWSNPTKHTLSAAVRLLSFVLSFALHFHININIFIVHFLFFHKYLSLRRRWLVARPVVTFPYGFDLTHSIKYKFTCMSAFCLHIFWKCTVTCVAFLKWIMWLLYFILWLITRIIPNTFQSIRKNHLSEHIFFLCSFKITNKKSPFMLRFKLYQMYSFSSVRSSFFVNWQPIGKQEHSEVAMEQINCVQ